MRIKYLSVACVLFIALCTSSGVLASTIVGSLDEGDFVGIDSTGVDFYYDLFEVTSLTTDPITITLETSDFAPFITWGLDLGLPPWPTGSDAPYGSFVEFAFSETPGAVSIVVENLGLGQTFDVLVGTAFYNPTDLGDYTLMFDGDVMVTAVPLPAALPLLGMALLCLGFNRKSKDH